MKPKLLLKYENPAEVDSRTYVLVEPRIAKLFAGIKVSPADETTNTQLAASLRQTEGGYDTLAAAARSGNKRGYAKAQTAVQRGEQSIAGALKGLQAAGYKIAA